MYAQNYTYLCVVLMYSAGLPILYPFAAIFYFVLYWVYKGLLLKYYARTTKFNQDIPIQSMGWVKFGLICHIFIASIMLSNNKYFPATKNDEVDGVSTAALATDEIDYLDNPYVQNFLGAYFERMAAGSQGAIYLSFIVILILIWIVLNVLHLILNFCGPILRPIIKIIKRCPCRCGKKTHVVRGKDIYLEFNVLSLENMLKKAREDLDDFEQNMGKGNSIGYKDDRYEEEINFEATTIIDMHKRRIK